MISNFSQNPDFFLLTLFTDYGRLRYLFFTLCLLIYMTIISANMVIIITVLLEKPLHQPMYVFIGCLSLNSLYGSTGFFPRFLSDLLSETHFISRPACFIQIYVIYTYASCEFTILGAMAYDRLVAICQPLHYHARMTLRKTLVLWGIGVLYSSCVIGYAVSLSVQLPLCGNKLHRIFCSNWPVVKNACIDTSSIYVTGQFVSVTTIFIPLLFVFFSYMKIIFVCRRSSTLVRGKALQTCVPHLVTFVVYSVSVFLELSLTRFDTNKINPIITAVLSLEYLMVPSINNPLIYGLKLPQIRTAIIHRFRMKADVQSK